jgi:hypothetical protein
MAANAKVRIIAAAALLAGLVGSGVMTSVVAASVGRHELSYTDRAEDGDPPQVALGIAMGALRGLFVNYLWIRANTAKEEGRYFEAVELARQITRLQPRFPRVWAFHGWNLAYNISVTTQTPEERWEWVNAGIRLLRDEGLRANPSDMLMHRELGWMFLHKVGGYTDDANQYYKRQLAYEWHNIMGPKPDVPAGSRDRDSVVEIYAGWVEDIVDAPDTRAALRERSREADAILAAYQAELGEPIGYEFLRRAQLHDELVRINQVALISRNAGPKTLGFIALRERFTNEQAWTDARNHVRKRVLIDDYNMEPVRMAQIVRKFGPVDWRLAGAHALYWSSRGTDVGRMEVNFHNSDSLDFVNTYRIVLQSVQDLWRFGDMYFNYLDVHEGQAGVYFVAPNPYFIPTYGGMLEEVVEASAIFESDRRAFRPYAAGYENFLKDAIRYFYRRGDMEQAEYWFSELRNWPHHNINDPDREMMMSLSLTDFVNVQLFESYGSPQVAVSEVYGALQGAFIEGLLAGDPERFEGLFNYARQAHALFMREQLRDVVAAQNTARMEYMDRDFSFVAGIALVNMIGALGPDEAEILYTYTPEDLRRYAYDAIEQRFKPGIDALAAQGLMESFDTLYPQPAGMEAHRAMVDRKLRERAERGVQGIGRD